MEQSPKVPFVSQGQVTWPQKLVKKAMDFITYKWWLFNRHHSIMIELLVICNLITVIKLQAYV